MGFYPVSIDMAGRRCLVVGGGVVAERKVGGLLEAGARVTVVSPAVTPQIVGWAGLGRIELVRRVYERGDLRAQSLVFVATDDGLVNTTAADDAREAGVLVNAADDPRHCDFILPAVLRRGELTIAVSTGGASPALSRIVRDELDAYVCREDYETLVRVAAAVRSALRARGVRTPWDTWRNALDGELRELVRTGRLGAARERLLERVDG